MTLEGGLGGGREDPSPGRTTSEPQIEGSTVRAEKSAEAEVRVGAPPRPDGPNLGDTLLETVAAPRGAGQDHVQTRTEPILLPSPVAAEQEIGPVPVHPWIDGVGQAPEGELRLPLRTGLVELEEHTHPRIREIGRLGPARIVLVAPQRSHRGGETDVVHPDPESETFLSPPFEASLKAGDLEVPGGNANPGSRGPARVTRGIQVDPQFAWEPLHLHALEQAEGKQRRVEGDAVRSQGQQRDPVEPPRDGTRPATPEARHLGPVEPPPAPEKGAGHPGNEIAHRFGIGPVDGVLIKDNEGVRGEEPFGADRGKHGGDGSGGRRHIEEAGGAIHCVRLGRVPHHGTRQWRERRGRRGVLPAQDPCPGDQNCQTKCHQSPKQ